MPSLIWNYKRERYEWIGGFGDRDIAKAAGLQWDAVATRWWTVFDHVAERLAEYASAGAIERLCGFQETLKASRSTAGTANIPCPEGLEYRPFQVAGIEWCLSRPASLLGDEMGLGKTIQAIGVINSSPDARTVLIVCPASLKLNWRYELRKWLVEPGFAIGVIDKNFIPKFFMGLRRLYIINYDVLAKHRDWLAEQQWDIAIFDEGHYMKNPDAKRTKSICGGKLDRFTKWVALPAKRKLWLTGTPMDNKIREIYTALKYLDPTAWSNFREFGLQYCAGRQYQVHTPKGRKWVWGFDGASNLQELQSRLRSTIMIRRKKADVLTELPDKVRQVIPLPADSSDLRKALKAEAAALKEARRNVTSSRHREKARAVKVAFDQIAIVRRDTAVAKAPAVAAYVDEVLDTRAIDKVVVFAHHKAVIRELHRRLVRYNSVIITGKTPIAQRDDCVKAFQENPACRVFIGNIQAAGVGLTLTAASTVIFAELDWSPGRMSQAEDRCHRIGQDDSVLVQHLVLDESIDANMANALTRKQVVIDAAIDTEDVNIDWMNELLNEKDRQDD